MNVPRGFMKIQQRITKVLSTILVVALCMTPELMNAATQQPAQSPTAPQQQQPPGNDQAAPSAPPAETQTEQQIQQQTQQQTGTTVDPSKAPLQPVTTYPEAPTPQQDQQQTTSQPVTTTTEPSPQTQKPANEPVGAAAAERVPTAGGAASKPAGAAIAPAKQHQTRSLLIKIGAIAAGGLAAGTVYALTRGTSSKPPGAATATQK